MLMSQSNNNFSKQFKNQLKNLVAASFLFLLAAPSMAIDVDLAGRSDKDMQQDAARKPAEMINFAGVKAGDHVLDLLAGGGYYTELLSRVVGEKGEVVLQVPEAYLEFAGKEIKERLAGDRLKNVTYLLSEASDLKLAENRFDSAFLVLGYHDMFYKDEGWNFKADAVMPQVLKSLKSGGKLFIVDHAAAKGRGTQDVEKLHRIESAFVIADLKKRGFRLIKQSDALSNKTDDHSQLVFDAALHRKTDRFVMLFEKI
jgi:predicted methyltransferase